MLKISITTAILSLLSLTSITTILYYSQQFWYQTNRKKKKIFIKNNTLPIIEVCLSDIQSLQQVILEGNCNSIELCSNRLEGGVTSSIGLIKQCVYHLRNSYNRIHTTSSVDLQVLIRPRPGGFIYTDDEFEIIQNDILEAKLAGANGIVFGAINNMGGIDIEKMKVIRRITEGMTLTFHRAFDILDHNNNCNDNNDNNNTNKSCDDTVTTLENLLDVIISLGCDRLLTSGGKTYHQIVDDAISITSTQTNIIPNNNNDKIVLPYNILGLQRLVKHANNRIVIIAASGITSTNVEEIIHQTHVKAIHVGKAVTEIISDVIIPTTSIIHNSEQQKLKNTLINNNNNSEMIQWNRVSKSLLSDLVDKSYHAWHYLNSNNNNNNDNDNNTSIINPSHINSIHETKTINSSIINNDLIEDISEETSDYVYISSKNISINSLK